MGGSGSRSRPWRVAGVLLVCFLAGCGLNKRGAMEGPVGLDERPVLTGAMKTGGPYSVFGATYRPMKQAHGYVAEGVASWYGSKFHGSLTANGERFDMFAISAAHATLPLPTQVRVTNLSNGRWTVARVNDRGPFVKGRLIDLSFSAAKLLGFARKGTTRVRIEALTPPDKMVSVGSKRVFVGSMHKRSAVLRKEAAPVIKRDKAKAAPVLKKGKAKAAPALKRDKAITDGRRGYFVQIGSFRQRANAEKLVQQVKPVGKPHIRSRTVRKKIFYRVLFGPFPSPIGADAIVTKLNRMGIGKPRIVMK